MEPPKDLARYFRKIPERQKGYNRHSKADDPILRTSEAGRMNAWGNTLLTQEVAVEAAPDNVKNRSWAIGLTSLFFILLQSACTAVMTLSGLRLLIGVGSLAAAATGIKFLVFLHAASIRIPMEFVAVAGSVINLYVIWRVRSLRARPSSQWRVGPVDPKKKRAESFQITLAVLTLCLVIVEWAIHIHWHGTI
jgi:hypothetical protein